jgi:hypothetical protein
MGEAPESGGEIEGHRESLRGRHPLYIKGSGHVGVSGLAKQDVVAFLAHVMEPTAASQAKSLRQFSAPVSSSGQRHAAPVQADRR